MTDMVDPYPVGYRISVYPMNWGDTHYVAYPMNSIAPAMGGGSHGIFGYARFGLFVRGGALASIWFGFAVFSYIGTD